VTAIRPVGRSERHGDCLPVPACSCRGRGTWRPGTWSLACDPATVHRPSGVAW